MVDIARFSMLALAVFMVIGGIVGFVKGRSKASFIAGMISAVALGVCFFLSQSQPLAGLLGGVVIASLLEVQFVVRMKKSGKRMPGLALAILCGICELPMLLGIAFQLTGTNM